MEKRKQPTYYALVVRLAGNWEHVFSDKSRECVEFERQGMRDHNVKACDLRIVKVTGRITDRAPLQRVLGALNA